MGLFGVMLTNAPGGYMAWDDDLNWMKLCEAKMDNDQLLYKDDSGNWVSYEKGDLPTKTE